MERTNHHLPFLFLLLFLLVPSHGSIIRHILMESQPPPPISSSSDLKRVILSIFSGLATGFLAALLVAGTITVFVRYVNTAPILKGPVVFSPKIDPKPLRLALQTQNQLIGSSPNGTYSKTCLENGVCIAVKRLEPFELGSPEIHNKGLKRRLQQELQVLAGLRHRHLMSLRAYVHESDRFCLVYDYVPTGSLEDALNKLRQNELIMGWDVRLRIVVGIIKALNFLHFECNPCVLHCNLKPSNVMLDAEFEPKLADCGLANFMPKLYRSQNGYRAPETAQNCSYTDKSDVFSFGVMLGVLLTGRDPLDPFFGEPTNGGSLGRWLRHLQQAGEPRQAIDKSLLGQEAEEEEMLMAVRIALVCMSESPEERPSSDELVPMLSRLHSF